MPSSHRFILKDSHPAILSAAFTGEVNTESQNDCVDGMTQESSESFTSREEYQRSVPRCRAFRNISSQNDKNGSSSGEGTSARPFLKERLKGRSYTTAYAEADRGLRVSDMRAGMKFAAMSITDDNPGTLETMGQEGPWHIQAMKMLLQDEVNAGGVESEAIDLSPEESVEFWKKEVHLPLSVLLKKYFNLTLDCHINRVGDGDFRTNKGGHIIDTQGYIAHNDTTIVLAYRCTDSNYDWMVNFTPTTSIWQTKDVERGHSGRYSSLEEIVGFNRSDESKQRIHTGFYNYFLCTVQDIHKYIDPLLLDKSKPRTLYLVGHSLGAGIAHCALCYFLFEYQCHEKQSKPQLYDWKNGPHRLVLVTAGSPRVYTTNLQCRVDNMLNPAHETYQKNVTVIRLVRGKDFITTMPPKALGFKHTSKCVFITKDDAVLINPSKKNVIPKKEFETLVQRHPSILRLREANVYDNDKDDSSSSSGCRDNDDDDDDKDDNKSSHDIMKQNVGIWYGKDKMHNEDQRDRAERAEEAVGTRSWDDGNQVDEEDRKYYELVRKKIRCARDHMPDFYLKPLMSLFLREQKGPIAPPEW